MFEIVSRCLSNIVTHRVTEEKRFEETNVDNA